MKVSVIFWDADFREHLHAIDYFCNQQFDQNEFEILWVDFYDSNETVRQKISAFPNARLYTIGEKKSCEWHLGRCLNLGIEHSSGELLIIPDGDIAVEPDFISYTYREHQDRDDLALYFHRYDEPRESSCDKSRSSLSHLKSNTKLTNPTNYAGCLSIRRDNLQRIRGYEIHHAFSGPGANGLELYTRIRNCGFCIKWSPDKKLYHPWHPGTGESKENKRKALLIARYNHSWINSYAGLEQSWIIYYRGLNGDVESSIDACDGYLRIIPDIRLDMYVDIIKRLDSQDWLNSIYLMESACSNAIQVIAHAINRTEEPTESDKELTHQLHTLLALRSKLDQPTVDAFTSELQIRLSKEGLLQTRITSLERNLTSCRGKLHDREIEIVRLKNSICIKIASMIKKVLSTGRFRKKEDH